MTAGGKIVEVPRETPWGDVVFWTNTLLVTLPVTGQGERRQRLPFRFTFCRYTNPRGLGDLRISYVETVPVYTNAPAEGMVGVVYVGKVLYEYANSTSYRRRLMTWDAKENDWLAIDVVTLLHRTLIPSDEFRTLRKQEDDEIFGRIVGSCMVMKNGEWAKPEIKVLPDIRHEMEKRKRPVNPVGKSGNMRGGGGSIGNGGH
jgi:hypothetical protein